MNRPSLARVSNQEQQKTFKVMLIGDSGVGKTCLLVRFNDDTFLCGSFIATVGIDYRNKTIFINDKPVKLQIYDTAGQERFRSIANSYYRDANALLLLYDVTAVSSFNNVRAWLSDVQEHAQSEVIVMLVGNKVDKSNERVVTREMGEKLANEYDVSYVETSAKTGLNVEFCFKAIGQALVQKSESIPSDGLNASQTLNNLIQLNRRQSTQRTNCCYFS